MIQKQRGTIDILPGESEVWQWMENKIKETASLYGYSEIRLPTFESSELYKRGVGETSDVVQKEMYSFEDNDKRSITLRPEGTAGVVRSVIENGLATGAMPLPLYYLISCFRYEKPEAGRSREFYQFGVEQFGAENAAADANVISLGYDIFKNLGIDVSLEINSIGCRHCRPIYHKALHDYFDSCKNDLCETCLDRLDKNPLRILDCKSPVCSEYAKNAPKTIDYLCPDCKKHLDELRTYLDRANIKYNVNPKIVRGLDYYQRTVFARLQQYVNHELPNVQEGFSKVRGTRDQIANICWIMEKAREFQKNIYFCFIDYTKALTVWITINCGKF